MSTLTNLLRRLLGSAVRPGVAPAGIAGPLRTDAAPRPAGGQDGPPSGDYPGDYSGTPKIAYAPHPDGNPDPGEVVWTWVPYEEDHRRGKDRPVLLIGHDRDWLLAVALTSKDHDRDAAQEHRAGRDWVDIGSGGWDRSGRPSEVRVNRILRVSSAAIRREGAVLDRDRFDQVAKAILAHRG